jgi:hypothetical protein
MHKLMDRYRGRRATEKGTLMADSSPYPDSGDDASAAPDGGSTTGTPRWVKVSGIIALILVLLVVVMLLIGGGPGGHGPGRHLGGEAPGRQTPSGDASGQRRTTGDTEQSGDHPGPPPGVEHGPQEP